MKKDLKIIFIISLVIIVIVGIVIFIKYQQKKETPMPENDSPYGLYNNEEEIKDDLLQAFTLYNTCSSGKYFDFNNKEKITLDDLNINTINHIIYNYLKNSNKITIKQLDNGNLVTFSKNDFSKAIEVLFGNKALKNYKFQNTIDILGSTLKLESNKYIGTIQNNGCLGNRWESYYNYRSYLENTDFYLEFVLYYLEYEHKIDNNKIDVINNAYRTKDSEKPICIEKNIEDNVDSFIKYRFVFNKENNNFIFNHIELIK